ncbi:hypothetical protein [Duganella sp. BJB476]|uniref:hypothetical protein n=1 Tax=Duganella sp. BJB476 TaxID=1871176 RepID=UPI001314ECC1|nr:hypothetical protein [Duganella sp. BJB476]
MKRLKEASTWAGFAAILQAAKMFVPPQYHILLDGATAIAGTVAGIVPEKGVQ